MRLVPPLPLRGEGTGHRPAGRVADDTGKPILDVLAELLVGDQLGDFRASAAAFGMPLRC